MMSAGCLSCGRQRGWRQRCALAGSLLHEPLSWLRSLTALAALPGEARADMAEPNFRTREPSASISRQQLPTSHLDFQTSVSINQIRKADIHGEEIGRASCRERV